MRQTDVLVDINKRMTTLISAVKGLHIGER